jgi:integrase
MTIARWLFGGLLFSRFRAKCSCVPEPASDQRFSRRRAFEGIAVRHKRRCSSAGGGVCSCSPSYQGQVWSARDRRPIRRTFGSLAEARAWRQESQVAVRRSTMRAPTSITVQEAAEEWLAAAEVGLVRTRSGSLYKPSALRSYEEALRTKLVPELGHLRLSAVSRNCVQDLVDRLVGEGFAPSSVRNAILPLRAIYRQAFSRGDVAVNPTLNLSLPALTPGRERVARAAEAAALIAALPLADRGLWATAMYAGLRRGELQALDWSAVDLDQGLIRVERSWDRRAGLIEPKSKAGKRRVPIPDVLRAHLLALKLQQGRGGQGFVFPSRNGRPFDPGSVAMRARRAWAGAGLKPIGLHECRHTYAAFMIAASVNAKALSTYMGHSTITVTLDRYGHLLPGNEREAAVLLDAWLDRSN